MCENDEQRVIRDYSNIIIGNSTFKNINRGKISMRRVVKRALPAKYVEEMQSEINSISSEPNLSHVIIFAGTNNIPNDTVWECVKNIRNLANCFQQRFPNSLIGLSSTNAQNDININTKINEINMELKELYEKKALNSLTIKTAVIYI